LPSPYQKDIYFMQTPAFPAFGLTRPLPPKRKTTKPLFGQTTSSASQPILFKGDIFSLNHSKPGNLRFSADRAGEKPKAVADRYDGFIALAHAMLFPPPHFTIRLAVTVGQSLERSSRA
jgi:hypothetical protein